MISLSDENNHIDYLRMYFCEPYQLKEGITIYQPHIQDIIDRGESEFYNMVYIFIGNTTFYRLYLWHAGIDWNKISDFELFASMVTSLEPDDTKILFGDLDFRNFQLYQLNISKLPEEQQKQYIEKYVVPKKNKTNTNNQDNKNSNQKQDKHEDKEEDITAWILYNKELNIEITEKDYNNMVFYLRTMFGIFPKVEYAKGKTAKEMIIEEEEQKVKLAQKEDKSASVLFSLVSSCLNHPGFKYKKNELREVGIFEFMDSVNRLQIYESSTALLKGIYSGFVSAKNINKDEFNFMRDIHKT